MRKSVVLALVLVFAIAGATFAATPNFSGNVTLEAESANSFTGPFALSPSLRLDTDFAEAGDNWSFDARLRSTWGGTGDVGVAVNRYKGVLSGDGVTSTFARNYALGHVDTPFAWVRIHSNPGATVDQLRVGANFGGVDVLTQLRSDKGDDLYLRAQTSVAAATFGTGMRFNLADTAESDYTGYLTTSVDIVDLRAVVGTFEGGDMEYAFGASADVTEQLNVGATYANATRGTVTKGYAVDGTFTEGLLQAAAGYAEEDKEMTASFIYRGSADNQTFGQLFDERANTDWTLKWYTNVAPAFGVYYTDTESADAEIKVIGVFPATEGFVARGRFVTQSNETEFGLEGWATVTEKLTLRPFFSKDRADVNTFGAEAIYAVSDNAEISVEGKQVGTVQSLLAGYSIDF